MSEPRARITPSCAAPGEHGGIGHFHWDLRADRWIWSPQLFQIHGLPETTTVSAEVLLDCMHPEDRDQALSVIDAARDAGGLFSCRYRICRADSGAVRIMVVVGEVDRDADAVAVAMHGFFVDVTKAPHPQDTPLAERHVDRGEPHQGGAEQLQVVRCGPVVALAGDVDTESRPTFLRSLEEAVACDACDVYIELTRVRYMDVRAVDALLATAETLRLSGRGLLVLGPPRIVRRVLDVLADARAELVTMLDPPDVQPRPRSDVVHEGA